MIFKVNKTASLECSDYFLGRLLPPSQAFIILKFGEVNDWDFEGIRIGCNSNQMPFSDDTSHAPNSEHEYKLARELKKIQLFELRGRSSTYIY